MTLAPWQRKCARCSMLTGSAAESLCRMCFDERARAVYWDKSTDACRAHGIGHAECLLSPGHDGMHEGNGYDDYGPKYCRWSDRKTRSPGAKSEVGR